MWSHMPLWVMSVEGRRDEIELVKGTDGQVKQLEKKEERVHVTPALSFLLLSCSMCTTGLLCHSYRTLLGIRRYLDT